MCLCLWMSIFFLLYIYILIISPTNTRNERIPILYYVQGHTPFRREARRVWTRRRGFGYCEADRTGSLRSQWQTRTSSDHRRVWWNAERVHRTTLKLTKDRSKIQIRRGNRRRRGTWLHPTIKNIIDTTEKAINYFLFSLSLSVFLFLFCLGVNTMLQNKNK